MCCWLCTLCHKIQHRAVLIIFPLNLQTITITRMLSGGGERLKTKAVFHTDAYNIPTIHKSNIWWLFWQILRHLFMCFFQLCYFYVVSVCRKPIIMTNRYSVYVFWLCCLLKLNINLILLKTLRFLLMFTLNNCQPTYAKHCKKLTQWSCSVQNCINQSINRSAWTCYGAPHPELWGTWNTMQIQEYHGVTVNYTLPYRIVW